MQPHWVLSCPVHHIVVLARACNHHVLLPLPDNRTHCHQRSNAAHWEQLPRITKQAGACNDKTWGHCRSMTSSADRSRLLLEDLKRLNDQAQEERKGARDAAVLQSYAVEMQVVHAELRRLRRRVDECHSAPPFAQRSRITHWSNMMHVFNDWEQALSQTSAGCVANTVTHA